MKQAILKWNAETFDVTPLLTRRISGLSPIYATEFGALFSADCLKILPLLKDEVVDTVFADPPFNLGKKYGQQTNDLKPDEEYLTLVLSLAYGMHPRTQARRLAFPLQSP